MSFSPYEPSQTKQKRDRTRPLLAFLVLIVAIVGLGLLALNYQRIVGLTPLSPTAVALASPTPPGSTGVSGPSQPTPQPTAPLGAPTRVGFASPVVPSATSQALTLEEQALRVLGEAEVPVRDLYSITSRLRKATGEVPRTTGRPAGDYKVGHEDIFNLSNISEKRYYTTTATIVVVTEHAYWYVENGGPVARGAIARIADAFEKKIYPTNRRLFGSEWTPGVDNDPRITVLFASIFGAGGYYSSADEYTRTINRFSNEREMIYIDIGSGGDMRGVESTLAHEYQHMIHWNERPNHDVWLNEGASVLASAANGYDVVGVDAHFMGDTDVQLTSWEANPNDSLSNYGASFLFLDFVRSQYGGDNIVKAVVAAPGQGADALDNALQSAGEKDRFADVFRKWVVANLVDGLPGAKEEGLDYPDHSVEASPQLVLDTYPVEESGDVAQFGADYIELQPPSAGGDLRVVFSGEADTSVVPTSAHSGTGIWWSNRGDLADTYMTRGFDLRSLTSATLKFHIWFDVELDLDYGYVEASTDGGVTWDTLKGDHTISANPNGTNYGNGYTGRSVERASADAKGWLAENIDLAPYVGKELLLRFEYITDDGYNAQGIAIDDLSIPELRYTDDAESDTGWDYSGFVRVPNKLDQTYFLSVIKFKDVGFDVQQVDVQPSGEVEFTVQDLGRLYSKAVVIVSGTTPHVIQRTDYRISVEAVK
ncbi:MAG: hypothetical protein ABIO92_09770 [Chloroflexia bacterium]